MVMFQKFILNQLLGIENMFFFPQAHLIKGLQKLIKIHNLNEKVENNSTTKIIKLKECEINKCTLVDILKYLTELKALFSSTH